MDTNTVAHRSTLDTRELRALELHRTRGREIFLIDANTYEVPSQDGLRTYNVEYGDVESCSCPDSAYRGVACVHLYAVGIHRAKKRGATARRLAALEERARHEGLRPDDRLEVLDEVLRLRQRLGR